jgi:hypothetical protein
MDKRSFLWLAAIWILGIVLSGCAPGASRPDGFAIYLVKGGSVDPGADLNRLELEPAPYLSLDDIVAYTWATHEIELTETARERVAQLEVPVTMGVPFVVCVGTERIYPGAFWVSYSSVSYDGIVVDTLPAQAGSPLVRFQLGYPGSPELFSGEDPRSDPRIQQSLRNAGKLR